MLFTFSKEIIPYEVVDGYGALAQCRLYQVFADGRKIGQYFGHRDVSFFACGDLDVQIDHDGYDKKVPGTRFLDRMTGTVTGKYQRRVGGQPARGRPFGTLWLGEKVYEAVEVNPEQKRRYQIQVGREDEQVVFLFGFDFEIGLTHIERSITQGTGFLSSENLPLIFGGLCLLEEFSEIVGHSSTW
ncbi:MAG TPA: hypothetical protein VNW04_20425 [Puia sp.]|nr:hypothetical protein [Puia sp.]